MKKGTKFEPKRITMLRELLQLSQVKFAEKIRISQGALSQIESGKSQISLDTLRNLSNELNVNCNWVVNGVGEIFYDDTKQPDTTDKQKVFIDVKKANDLSLIPLVQEEAHAGYIDGFESPEYIKTLKVYQIPGFENGSYRLFEIDGESMIPTIYPREIVICEFIEDKELVENGTLCVVITKDGIVAKRIHYYENDKKLLILKSDNSHFKTYSLESNKILELWKIKGKITSVFIESGLVDAKRMEKLENDLEMLKKEVRMLSDR
ncbi:LexA family transcriptional regulator [Fulvivirga sp. 29W222]|uniref:LexA family transcriptional regulator n=1 Tax=Fulvivirga marina TaxID=2494733 RepID=A0A937G0M1_9BACT|nr:LexA family transcriptional regulator [Fulvivirga marina]MBL6449504.1 LexA family transcriptional regulator [Fulvivirga marina]